MRVFFFLILLFFSNLYCSEFSNYFEKLPILKDGRVRPLSSFSSECYYNISENFFSKSNHIDWFVSLTTGDEKILNEKNIYIKNNYIISLLDIKKNKNNYYSFNDIYFSIEKNKDYIIYLLNLNSENIDEDQKNLLNIFKKTLIYINFNNFFFKNNSSENIFFYDYERKKWVNFNNLSTNVLDIYIKIFDYYKKNDIKNFTKNFNFLYFKITSNLKKNQIYSLKSEFFYNKIDTIKNSFFLYLLSLFIIFIIFFFNRFNLIKIFKLIFLLGFSFHFSSILLRFFITFRPPVSNLFESILFINFMFSLTILFYLFFRNLNKFYIFFSMLFVTIMQYVSLKFSLGNDTMYVLLPVLDTNFWLTIHVITISIGYFLCIFLGVLIHLFFYLLYQNNFNNLDNKFYNFLYFLCILSLFFVFSGTVLGGIWADQSWGRFWGWDPKENGALLIVLWLIFTLHLKYTNFFNNFIFSICIFINNIFVAIAWFGVNLLNTGLHSYGFVKNIESGLFLFCLFELFYFIFFIVLKKMKKLTFFKI